MAQRQRRVFGPLLKGTLVVAGLVLAGAGLKRWRDACRPYWAARSLAGNLRSRVLRLRHDTAERLAGIGAPAVPVLIEALRDPDGDVRVQSCSVLLQAGAKPETAVPAFLGLLGDERADVRRAAIEELKRVSALWGTTVARSQRDEITARLRSRLKDADPPVRVAAANALEHYRDQSPETIVALCHALGDRDPRVVITAAAALARVAPQEAHRAFPLLRPLLGNSEFGRPFDGGYWPLSGAALSVLSEIPPDGETRAIERLIACVRSDVTDRQLCAMRDLGWSGPRARSAIPALLDASDAATGRARAAAIESLLQIDPNALRRSLSRAKLVELALDPNLRSGTRIFTVRWLREEQPQALANVVAGLVKQLHAAQFDERAAAIDVFELVGTDAKAAVPDLLEICAGQSADDEMRARAALAAIDPRALRSLPARPAK